MRFNKKELIEVWRQLKKNFRSRCMIYEEIISDSLRAFSDEEIQKIKREKEAWIIENDPIYAAWLGLTKYGAELRKTCEQIKEESNK